MDQRLSEAPTSADDIKSFNSELKEQLTRLRSQLEISKCGIRSDHWQKVLEVRAVRAEEQEKAARAVHQQWVRAERDKARAMLALRQTLVTRYRHETLRLQRRKEAELTQLRLELQAKETVIRRMVKESRKLSLQVPLTDQAAKIRLLQEVSEAKSGQRELEELLEAANTALRNHSDQLRRQEELHQSQVARIRRDSACEVRQLIEQLRSKDKVISQLERELGHPAATTVAAALVTTATTEVKGATCQASPEQPGGGNRMESPTACGYPPHGLVSGLTQAYHTLHGTAIVSVRTDELAKSAACLRSIK